MTTSDSKSNVSRIFQVQILFKSAPVSMGKRDEALHPFIPAKSGEKPFNSLNFVNWVNLMTRFAKSCYIISTSCNGESNFKEL